MENLPKELQEMLDIAEKSANEQQESLTAIQRDVINFRRESGRIFQNFMDLEIEQLKQDLKALKFVNERKTEIVFPNTSHIIKNILTTKPDKSLIDKKIALTTRVNALLKCLQLTNESVVE
ncbi:CLUMA_CG020354, isoform A [Clunio marinus]|uniref:CLUMA_CG020354, isoform A n=1 Tax=Clunio marinus TaxID=568069 RepID=A0A1J1J8U4_9DIPT|nr:CLUMA_CG020354, isoform A [Clunio marinus]